MEDTVFEYLDKRILSFYHEALQIQRGQFPKPRFMILYPTNRCPFDCTFCDYADLNRKKKRYLKPTEWEYLLNEFRSHGGMAIELCGGGEPLATPGVENLITYARALGLRIGLLTNGYYLDKKRFPLIYRAVLNNCSYVRVSMESASQKVFDTVRRAKKRDLFTTILDNVTTLIEEKSATMQVSYKYTIGAVCDIEDIYRAVRIAEERGFDSVQFKPASNVASGLKEDRGRLEEKIRAYALGRLKKTALLCDLRRHRLDAETGCFMSPIHTLIDYNGDMFICCYYRHRISDHRIGNVFETSFRETWHSYVHWEKIKGIDIRKCNLYDCRFIKYNRIMKHALETGQLEFI